MSHSIPPIIKLHEAPVRQVFLAVALLLPVAAFAQQPPIQQQLDSGTAAVMRIVTMMSGQISADQQELAQLKQQIADLQKQLATKPKEQPAP